MAELSLFEYIRQTGITGLELCLLLGVAFFGWMCWAMVRERQRARHTPPSEPVTPVVGVVSTLCVVLTLGYFAYDVAHHRYQVNYQLRPEASRYVVGTVFSISELKRGPIYNYRYQAQGQSYEGYAYCDSSGCPPVGRRYFITYALADPGFSLSLGLPVPDSLGAAPGQEWKELP